MDQKYLVWMILHSVIYRLSNQECLNCCTPVFGELSDCIQDCLQNKPDSILLQCDFGSDTEDRCGLTFMSFDSTTRDVEWDSRDNNGFLNAYVDSAALPGVYPVFGIESAALQLEYSGPVCVCMTVLTKVDVYGFVWVDVALGLDSQIWVSKDSSVNNLFTGCVTVEGFSNGQSIKCLMATDDDITGITDFLFGITDLEVSAEACAKEDLRNLNPQMP